MATTSPGLSGTGRSSSFPTLCPCGARASPGDRVAGLWSPGLFGLRWFMRGWEPVGRLQRGLRQAPGASWPGPFSGRAARPQCGRGGPGTAVAHLKGPSFRFVPKWSTKRPDHGNFEKASLPSFLEIKKEQKLLGFL
ncbi:uncharacterized protein LOC129040121 [Pongo pygmaeus]|uniref:uncharacterized protein LOC129040121 n=1 Tax=Pongo pygmaeus TaxID=9600 RepID=UPI0023E1A122|nr:uncharacterized protein LOC129040121 [Pongo pygmaeus]